MARYHAEPGQEDRHGEMTGAITIGYMMLMPPIAVWSIFIGPALVGLTWTLIVAVMLAVVGSFAMRPIMRRIWARVSDYMDHSEF